MVFKLGDFVFVFRECSLLVQYFPNMGKALGSIPKRGKRGAQYRKEFQAYISWNS